MKKYILFDWDDTLWDFQHNSFLAMQQMYEQECLSTYFSSFDEFYVLYHGKNHELWELYGKGEITKEFLIVERFHYPLRTVGHDDISLAKKLNPIYLELTTKQTTLVSGAKEVVERLAKKYQLVVISNGFTEVQHTKIQQSTLGNYFTHIVLSEQVGVQKPDKRFFDFTLREIGAEVDECIVVGDMYSSDIMGAINAGIESVFYNPKCLDYPPHKLIVSSIADLRELEVLLP